MNHANKNEVKAIIKIFFFLFNAYKNEQKLLAYMLMFVGFQTIYVDSRPLWYEHSMTVDAVGVFGLAFHLLYKSSHHTATWSWD